MNHNELLTFPIASTSVLFGTVQQATTSAPLPLAQPSISAPIKAPARSSNQPGPRATLIIRHGHGSLVLSPQQRLQEGQGLSLPPTSPPGQIISA